MLEKSAKYYVYYYNLLNQSHIHTEIVVWIKWLKFKAETFFKLYHCWSSANKGIRWIIALINLESNSISSLEYQISLYFRYIDDILTLAPHDLVQHERFNTFHSKLKFSLESAINDSINFLDVTLTNMNTHIATNWYRKNT